MERALKYPSTPHWPWSQTVHRDDSYHAKPDWFVGLPVVITEKLDGGNTSLFQGEVYARSVVQPSRAGWMGMVRKHHAWKSLEYPDHQFYGEDLFGIHSIEYDAMPEEQTYRLFATRDKDQFQSWDDVREFAVKLGVQTVPVLFDGFFYSTDEITKWFEERIKQPSVLGGECEGFVMRYAAPFPPEHFSMCVAKYVRANHVQTDQHWTRNWKPCQLT